jgi:cell division protease FtsH
MLQAPGEPQLRGDYSEQTARAIDDEVRRIIDEQRDRATEILSQRHEVLLRAAQVLLAKETITGDELRELLAASEPSEHSTDDEPHASDVHAV